MVSLSNHERPFDKLRANGINLFSKQVFSVRDSLLTIPVSLSSGQDCEHSDCSFTQVHFLDYPEVSHSESIDTLHPFEWLDITSAKGILGEGLKTSVKSEGGV